MVKIPLVGAIAAGRPIEAIEEKETLAVPKNLLARSGEHFVLRVKGDSMINDGVFNGDKVIIRKQNEAENGDMVVALINQEEATLKRFFKEKDKIRLQPANPSFKPIYAKNVTIQGRDISVIRNFGNNEENSDFTENTTSYINQADIKYRKKLGQYFTPKPVREALIEQLPKNINHPKILDPACGSKMFWFDKDADDVVFGDIRRENHILCDGRTLEISPDVQLDFTARAAARNGLRPLNQVNRGRTAEVKRR